MQEKEPKRPQKSLPPNERSANLYKDLFDLSPTPGAIFDEEGYCQIANLAFNTRLGYDPPDLLSKPFSVNELFDNPKNAKVFLLQLQERRIIRRLEARIKDKEGNTFPVLLSGRIIDSSEHVSFELSFTDISQQKDLQRSIRREQERIASLVESITIGLFLVNNQGIITSINLSLANMISLDEKTLKGQSYELLFGHLISDAQEPEVVQQSLKSAVLNVTNHPSVEITLEKGGPSYLEFSFFPVRDKNGLPMGWGGLVQDVTEARSQIAWKLELLSILAHDLRTPLATLKGHATALLANYHNWGDELITEFLEAIDRGIDELVHQVDRNLALTRVEAGRLGLRPEAVEPERLIRQAVERAAGSLMDLPVQYDLPEELPKVRADPARMEEVLVNLLENAARYNPPGFPILLSASSERNWVKISVIDHGPGVPKEKQNQIFEKYARAEHEGGGTGLGLFISRKIVEAHGGRIWVESPPSGLEHGAEFVFRLPRMPSPVEIPAKLENQPKVAVEIGDERQRILVVEDEPDSQALIRTILTDESYRVELAPDGPTALDIIQTSPPHLVLLDWMLPGMSGISVCRNIRRWSNVPIIMVTSKSASEDLITALDAGADDYIIKPFKRGELLARIRASLRRGESWAVDEENSQYSAMGLLIDFNLRQAWMNGELLELTPTEFDLLAYMARHTRQLLTYDQILEEVWGSNTAGTRHGLFVHISRLRRKIEADPANPRFIVTRWRLGYVFLPG